MTATTAKTEITEKDLEQKLSGFRPEERESSILIDHFDKLCYIETSHPATARKLLDIARDNPEIINIDLRKDTFSVSLPVKFVRSTELIITPSLRT